MLCETLDGWWMRQPITKACTTKVEDTYNPRALDDSIVDPFGQFLLMSF